MRFTVLLPAFLVFSLAVASGWAAPFNLDSLLIKSVGGAEAADSVRALRSITVTGQISLNGQPGTLTQVYVAPNLYYAEQEFAYFRLVQAYDGATAWQMDHNGQVTELSGYEKRELLKGLYFDSYAYLIPGREQGELTYSQVIEGEAGAFHEVLFLLDGDTVKSYFDTTSGVRTLMQSRIDNTIAYVHAEDFRPVHAILFPFRQQFYSPEMGMMIELNVDSVAINEPVDTSLFLRPDTRAHTYALAQGASETTVPFTFFNGHINVPVKINGKTLLWMILDSGASSSVFHLPAVADLGLPVVGASSAKGLGGYVSIEMLQVDSLDIGSLTVHSLMPGAADLADVARTASDRMPFGGVLGNDFLSRFPVMVDYVKRTLTIYDPQSFAPPEGGTAVPFELTMQVPTVNASVEGVPGKFIVDMGNAFALVLHHDYIEANRMTEKLADLRAGSMLGGMGGAVGGFTGMARQIALGTIAIDSVEVVLPGVSEGLTGSAELAGNIGNQVLRRYTVLFDYPRNQIIFYPPSRDPENP